MWREDINDAVNRLGSATGVKGCDDEVTSFRSEKSGRNRFQVSHFADANDIGVLTQNLDEGLGETGNIGANFLLNDNAQSVLVVVFHRVFNSHNFASPLTVDEVNHRIHCGRFA